MFYNSFKYDCVATIWPRIIALDVHRTASIQIRRLIASRSVPTLYEILGVSASCTKEEIRDSFIKSAKRLHPDISSKGEDEQPFVQLLHAYTILKDPSLRAKYDISITDSQPATIRKTAAQSLDDIPMAWGLDGLLRPPVGSTTTALDTIRSQLHAEFKEALSTALFGPPLDDLEVGHLPPCFEAEQRANPTISKDVLHLVSGRTILGTVEERDFKRIEGGDCGTEGDGEVPNEMASCILDMHVAEARIATGVATLSAIRGTSMKKTFEMKYLDIYRNDQASMYASIQRIDGSTFHIKDQNGEHTHTALLSFTPLVRHLSFLTHKHRLKNKGVLIARAHKAWLPSSSLWFFKPRVETHNVGGWYIEWSGHAVETSPAYLAPEVIVLIAAVHSL